MYIKDVRNLVAKVFDEHFSEEGYVVDWYVQFCIDILVEVGVVCWSMPNLSCMHGAGSTDLCIELQEDVVLSPSKVAAIVAETKRLVAGHKVCANRTGWF